MKNYEVWFHVNENDVTHQHNDFMVIGAENPSEIMQEFKRRIDEEFDYDFSDISLSSIEAYKGENNLRKPPIDIAELKIPEFLETLEAEKNSSYEEEIARKLSEYTNEKWLGELTDYAVEKGYNPHTDIYKVEQTACDFIREKISDKELTDLSSATDKELFLNLKEAMENNAENAEIYVKECYSRLITLETDTFDLIVEGVAENIREALNEREKEEAIKAILAHPDEEKFLDFTNKVDEHEEVLDDGEINAILALNDEECEEIFKRGGFEEKIGMTFDEMQDKTDMLMNVYAVSEKDEENGKSEIKLYATCSDDSLWKDGYIPVSADELETLIDDIGRAVEARGEQEYLKEETDLDLD